MNYYELFDISPSLMVDAAVLRRRYLQLSRQYHPDNFGQGSGTEQSIALEKTELINQAYKVLGNEADALEYFLLYKEIIQEGSKHQLGSDFLMEMMELNEAKMDLEADGDEVGLEDLLAKISKAKAQKMEQLQQECVTDNPNKDRIAALFYQIRYFDRFLGERPKM